MIKKTKDIFLSSVIGVKPIKKTNKLINKIPKTNKKIFIKKNEETEPTKFKPITENKIVGKNIENNYFVVKNKINKKLKKGKIPIDKKFDFHGYSLVDAENLFISSIIDCYQKNLRCLLFVTGKGVTKRTYSDYSETKLYYGKIRNSFLDWTKKNELNKFILNFDKVDIEHGSDGAFYVYLRKQKN